MRVHVASHSAMRDAMFVGNFEFHALSAGQRKKILRYRDAIEEVFGDCIQAGCDDGSFQVRDVSIARVAVVSLCVSVLNWFAPGGRLSPEQVGDLYAELVLSMVRADKAATGVHHGRAEVKRLPVPRT